MKIALSVLALIVAVVLMARRYLGHFSYSQHEPTPNPYPSSPYPVRPKEPKTKLPETKTTGLLSWF